jgi:hypothetical protein
MYWDLMSLQRGYSNEQCLSRDRRRHDDVRINATLCLTGLRICGKKRGSSRTYWSRIKREVNRRIEVRVIVNMRFIRMIETHTGKRDVLHISKPLMNIEASSSLADVKFR